MTLLPASPRRRRRLARLAATLAVVGAVAAVVAALPEAKPPPPSAASPGGAAEEPVEREEPEVPLAPEDRAAINATVDRFVAAALERRDNALAWELAGPGLRAGATREEWLSGNHPVMPFPAKGERFHGWEPLYSYRDRVGFDLLIHAEPRSRRGAISFAVEMVRHDGRWLVDTWYPSGIFSSPDERPWVIGAVDFTPTYDQRDYYETPKFAQSRLGAGWLAIPGAIFAALLLLPVALWARGLLRKRRAEAEYLAARAGRPA